MGLATVVQILDGAIVLVCLHFLIGLRLTTGAVGAQLISQRREQVEDFQSDVSDLLQEVLRKAVLGAVATKLFPDESASLFLSREACDRGQLM